MRIAHLTSAHPRHDVRIFVKECRSLARAGHEVTLVVADGRGDEMRDGVRIVDVGAPAGRLDRALRAARRVTDFAMRSDATICHLHDPELVPGGLRLKRAGKKVVFDSHEDLPRQILEKPYLARPVRRVVSMAAEAYENYACRRLDGIVGATPLIRDRFGRINPNAVNVNNFPILGELETVERRAPDGPPTVLYVGAITAARGIRQMVDAMDRVRSDASLSLAGRFSEPSLRDEMAGKPGWARVHEAGFLDRTGIRDTMAGAVAGLVTLQPVPAYIDALPIKLFEYMSAGLPVIASDFPVWRAIVEEHDCGLLVDPRDPGAIAAAIDMVIAHPERALEMGRNGSEAVKRKFNWGFEEKKLLAFYASLDAESRA